MKQFLQAVEKHYGKRPMIYTSIDFYRDVIIGELHDYPLWVRTVNAEPMERYGDRRWMMWQYTDMGRVPGIKGNVDRNAFAGTEEDWMRFTGQPMMRVADAAPVAPSAPVVPMVNIPVPRPKGLIARN